jgi:hypothetical protein
VCGACASGHWSAAHCVWRHCLLAALHSLAANGCLTHPTQPTQVHQTVTAGGKVLVPVFAVGRAQELLLLLDEHWQRTQLEVSGPGGAFAGKGLGSTGVCVRACVRACVCVRVCVPPVGEPPMALTQMKGTITLEPSMVRYVCVLCRWEGSGVGRLWGRQGVCVRAVQACRPHVVT